MLHDLEPGRHRRDRVHADRECTRGGDPRRVALAHGTGLARRRLRAPAHAAAVALLRPSRHRRRRRGALHDMAREDTRGGRAAARLNEDLEIKGRYSRSQHDRGALVRTIVAMANTQGGRILLQSIEGDPASLELDRLDDVVNAYVAPQLRGIASTVKLDGAVETVVPESELKPQVCIAAPD